ncbi:MAG: alanine racemase [Cyclobacteriaceae bacterium]|nr:alanine racemase [Cyclobacteriaceae bacterium HetDA_MAG_MS6]
MLNITVPTLLLDETRCKENIKTMAEKAAKNNLIFRPHFKTHQSLQVGGWFRAEGITKITVSSLAMAEYFAPEWADITVAFPMNVLESERINRLASQITLNLIAESAKSIALLAKSLKNKVGIFLKIDVGYHRTGLDPEDKQIALLIQEIESQPNMTFKGFLAHAGHSYDTNEISKLNDIHHHSLEILTRLRKKHFAGRQDLVISTGDTPSASQVDSFPGIDELRPGNFAFYDLFQWNRGSCTIDQIAVCMACPVVAKHRSRNEIVLYGGGVHFSKDRIRLQSTGQEVYGLPVKGFDNWTPFGTDNYVSKLSQEHGTVKVTDEVFDRYEIGDIMYVLPVHSCLTANLMKSFTTLQGVVITRL